MQVSKTFVAELDPDGGSFPPNVGALADLLKAWRNKVQSQLEDSAPASLVLEEESPKLQVGAVALLLLLLPGLCGVVWLGGGVELSATRGVLQVVSCTLLSPPTSVRLILTSLRRFQQPLHHVLPT
jgi:hypothetical protein